jgi:hypothetical protein
MKYPPWAPAELVENLGFTQASISSRELFEARLPIDRAKAPSGSLLALDDSKSPFSLANMKAQAQLEERMLTDLRAEEIWVAAKAACDKATPIPGGKWSIEFDFMSACHRAYKECKKQPKITPKEKRRHFEKIASLADSLAELLNADISDRHLSWQKVLLEAASCAPYEDMLDAMRGAKWLARAERREHSKKEFAAVDAWRQANGFADEYEPTPEEEAMLIFPEDPKITPSELLDCIGELTLPIFLKRLSDESMSAAEIPPMASQPGSDGWEKVLFVRNFSEYLTLRFGRPMWRVLALTTSVALGIDTLGEEDVMPLVSYQKKIRKNR